LDGVSNPSADAPPISSGGLEAAALDSGNLDNTKSGQTVAYSRIQRYDD
jgi:hypothetical protein